MTAHLDIFNDRLLNGFTLAESAYMATRGLSWMTVVVGDPLYRPYASWFQIDLKKAAAPRNNWQMYHDFAPRNAREDLAKYLADGRRAGSRANNGPMIEDLGLMQKEAGDFSGAISYLQQARTIYKQRGDLLRVVLEQADALIQADRKKEALALVKSTMALVSDAPSTALLKKVADQLSPPTPTPAPH
jgi:tetratricopeptide (TPR) repeat protein